MGATVVQSPYASVVVSTAGGASVPAAKFLLGVINLSGSAQTGITFTVTDNNANSGPVLTAPAASASINYPPPGYPINGINIAVSGGTPSAPGVAFLYRTAAA